MSTLNEIMAMEWQLPTDTVESPAALRAAQPDFPPAFTVRMPTAEDMACFDEAADKARNLTALMTAFQAGNLGEKAEALKAAVGLDGSPNETYIKQIEMILRCVTEPVLDREQTLWLGRHFPLTFRVLVKRIVSLIDGGASLGKSPDSGETPPLEPA